MIHNPAAKSALFHWKTGRSTQCLHEIVPGEFRGVIQCDGYSAYGSFAQSPQRAGTIRLAGCWAHVRRGFFEARQYSPDAVWVLNQIQKLYAVEAQLRESRAGPEEREAARQEHSLPVVVELRDQLLQWDQSHRHLPRSPTGGAVRYALGQWSGLAVFLEDGRVELDNNLTENMIRPCALGRKNWLCVSRKEVSDVKRAAA